MSTAQAPRAGIAPGAPADEASPTGQVAAALVQVAHGQAGAHQVTVRLDPIELGQVHVRIDRAADGSTAIQVTVARPETLHLLMADKPQLQAALANAGLPSGSSLSLSLGTPDAGAGSTGQGSPNPGGNGQGGRQPARPWFQTSDAPPTSTTAAWLKAGVDILA